jgi:aminoglycoside 3-N-acetyltransferase
MIKEKLVQSWIKSGLSSGDCVLIHSDILRTVMLNPGMITPQLILESFLEAVGPAGTVLFPLFNFDFTKGVPFDIRNTPSQMGALTEAARLRPDAVRTGHPIYSFAVIGSKSAKFEGVDNFSGYAENSPFGILRELDGKIAVLDLPDQHSMTFYHHVEEVHKVEYRYHKTFTGSYTDISGSTEQRTYGLYVRDIERGVLTHINPTGELMWEAGLYSGDRAKEGSGLRVISARKMYDFVSKIIVSGKAKGLLYRLEGEE